MKSVIFLACNYIHSSYYLYLFCSSLSVLLSSSWSSACPSITMYAKETESKNNKIFLANLFAGEEMDRLVSLEVMEAHFLRVFKFFLTVEKYLNFIQKYIYYFFRPSVERTLDLFKTFLNPHKMNIMSYQTFRTK